MNLTQDYAGESFASSSNINYLLWQYFLFYGGNGLLLMLGFL